MTALRLLDALRNPGVAHNASVIGNGRQQFLKFLPLANRNFQIVQAIDEPILNELEAAKFGRIKSAIANLLAQRVIQRIESNCLSVVVCFKIRRDLQCVLQLVQMLRSVCQRPAEGTEKAAGP